MTDKEMKESFEKAAEAIKNSDALYITAGAGIGVDSGLPDFRGKHGFWRAYPPIARLGLSFEQMASPVWFHRNPELAWAFYGHRLNLYRRTIPHEGFYHLLELGKQKPGGYFVFTSNVDGQFQKAGYKDERVEECHGSIHHLQCVEPCNDDIWDASDTEVIVNKEKFVARPPLPRCPTCGKTARPNVLMFGDWLWLPERSHRQSTRKKAWISSLTRSGRQPVIIEIGAGLAVPTVRWESERLAQNLDALLIRINPRDFSVPSAKHISLPSGAREGINGILTNL